MGMSRPSGEFVQGQCAGRFSLRTITNTKILCETLVCAPFTLARGTLTSYGTISSSMPVAVPRELHDSLQLLTTLVRGKGPVDALLTAIRQGFSAGFYTLDAVLKANRAWLEIGKPRRWNIQKFSFVLFQNRQALSPFNPLLVYRLFCQLTLLHTMHGPLGPTLIYLHSTFIRAIHCSTWSRIPRRRVNVLEFALAHPFDGLLAIVAIKPSSLVVSPNLRILQEKSRNNP